LNLAIDYDTNYDTINDTTDATTANKIKYKITGCVLAIKHALASTHTLARTYALARTCALDYDRPLVVALDIHTLDNVLLLVYNGEFARCDMPANLAAVLAQWNAFARDMNVLACEMDVSALMPKVYAYALNVDIFLANSLNCAVNVTVVIVNRAALVVLDNLALARPMLELCYVNPYAHETNRPLPLLGSPGENPFVFDFEPDPLNLLNLVLAKPI
jgi:hypothetical protein